MTDLDLLSELLKRIKRLERKVKVLEGETPTKRFEPPTIDQVRAYCKERNNGVDPTQFIDFYTAKNWMIGKNKMKDYMAAIRTWEKSDTTEPTGRNEGQDIPMDYGVPSESSMTRQQYLKLKEGKNVAQNK